MKTEKKQKVKVAKQKFSWQLIIEAAVSAVDVGTFVIWLIILICSRCKVDNGVSVKPNSCTSPVWQEKI